MRKALTFLLILVLTTTARAQANPPDYQVSVTNRSVSADSSVIILQFSVFNLGGAASASTQANLYLDNDEDALLASQPLRALGERPDSELLTFTISLDELPGGNVDFRLEVGIGDIEPAGGPTVGNNTARVGYLLPTLTAPRTTRTPVPASSAPIATDVPPPTPLPPTATPAPSTIEIEGLPFTIDLAELDLANPLTIAGIIALFGVGLILLWVLTVILRLIFRPPRIFEVWQPPYAAVPPHDPNTLAGRRQLWQHNAQSDSMNAPGIDGQYHIRKVLLGIDGKPLSGWRIRGLRLSQYDIYGRVARSQTLASNGALRRLDRAARRSAVLKEADADKWVKPVARELTRAFFRNINRKSMMLPVAVDLRFRGAHGEVRIVFELYQYVGGQFQQIDRWEPEMTVVSGGIQENFTYTLLGMRQGETPRTFRQRLQHDLHAALKGMLYKPVIIETSPTPGDTSPSQPIPAPQPDSSSATALGMPRVEIIPDDQAGDTRSG